jgi:hypothetical protein
MIGGYLSQHLPQLFQWKLQSLFLLSSLLRFIIFGIFFFRFKSFETEHEKSLEIFFKYQDIVEEWYSAQCVQSIQK